MRSALMWVVVEGKPGSQSQPESKINIDTVLRAFPVHELMHLFLN